MRAGKIIFCLVVGMASNAVLFADGNLPARKPYVPPPPGVHARAAWSGNRLPVNNPYASVVARNVFGLNPPQAVNPVEAVPLGKITANGIMTILGKKQVLYKVTEAGRMGQPAKDQSYIATEGDRQDDIEVNHIDEQSGVVTFDNHGTIQEISLTKASPVSPIATVPAPAAVRTFNPAPAANNNGGASVFGFGNRLNRNRALNNNNNNNSSGATGGMDSSTPQQFQGLPPGMSGEDQAVIIAANHAAHQNDSTGPLYPPTRFDADAGITPTPPPQ
jgi:hypothetical protein